MGPSNIDSELYYFYQPPKPHGDLIDGVAMPEAMHSDTLDYLLPNKEDEPCPIGARHLCGGKMFCVSFHALSKDEIKCYLYIDQKCIRLNLVEKQPLTDLMHILPHYFSDDSFEPINVEKALRGTDFGNDTEKVIKFVKQWMNRWAENEREWRLLNDLEEVELKSLDKTGPIYIDKLSRLGEFVSTKCGWNDSDLPADKRLDLQFKLYLTLRKVYRIPPIKSNDWLNLGSIHGVPTSDKDTSYPHFSTKDREYDELGRKLGILQK